MKAKADPRHQRRVKLMKNLYTFSFEPKSVTDKASIEDIVSKLGEIDSLIATCAPEWPIDQINRIDLSILRLSIHELEVRDTPYKVVIDEAVEIAKEYGSENSAKFVNGVLGHVVATLEKEGK
jgi:transcription antitermination protein NusB